MRDRLHKEKYLRKGGIGSRLLTLAGQEPAPQKVGISGDSDLTTPIRRVRERFPAKRVIVAFPSRRHSKALKQHANGHLAISENKLRASQFPDKIVKPDDFMLQRPATWR